MPTYNINGDMHGFLWRIYTHKNNDSDNTATSDTQTVQKKPIKDTRKLGSI